MDLGLNGKVAVITGASIGIGLAVAEGLAAEGAHIVLAARQPERLSAEATRIAGTYGVKTLPGIREAIEQHNWEEAKQQISAAQQVIDQLSKQLENIALGQ